MGDKVAEIDAVGRDREWALEFEQFYRDNYARFGRMAWRLTGHHHDAQDLVNQTLEKVARAWPPPRTKERSYVHTTMVRTWIDECRARKARPPEVELFEEASVFAIDDVEDRAIRSADQLAYLKSLKKDELEVFALRCQGLTWKQVEKELYMSSSKAERIFRRVYESAAAVGILFDDLVQPPRPTRAGSRGGAHRGDRRRGAAEEATDV